MRKTMNTFEDIKTQWNNQKRPDFPKDGLDAILSKTNSIRQKQRWTNIILSITILILVGFFFYISGFKNQSVSLALGLMIFSLIIRIGLEVYSITRLKALNFSSNATTFKMKMIAYYKSRIRTHYVFTPILIIAYCIGFITLLPFFKQSLSSGFYLYIKISAVVVLIVMSGFIAHQIQKEVLILKSISIR